ncbi:MAG: hypothetical protein KGH59_03880 [Candidatus Micrarchaeota archaeon]|nr:hypothetical protein [Candidatus Micrarchaeota archaeon]MDE1804892.1 hypothetical protein [Candidatus Micrarchaeota archaeon]MDE1846653.1 hypothetical protein [Candidatus Micrarchaeota archaeon]
MISQALVIFFHLVSISSAIGIGACANLQIAISIIRGSPGSQAAKPIAALMALFVLSELVGHLMPGLFPGA